MNNYNLVIFIAKQFFFENRRYIIYVVYVLYSTYSQNFFASFNSICSSNTFCISICQVSSCCPSFTFWLITFSKKWISLKKGFNNFTSSSCWFVWISSPFVMDSSIQASFFSFTATFLSCESQIRIWIQSYITMFYLKSVSLIFTSIASFKLSLVPRLWAFKSLSNILTWSSNSLFFKSAVVNWVVSWVSFLSFSLDFKISFSDFFWHLSNKVSEFFSLTYMYCKRMIIEQFWCILKVNL